MHIGRVVSLLLAVALSLAACDAAITSGVRLVSASGAAEVLADHSEVVVLDIRTPEEFADGHLAGASNIDFYDADFRMRLESLDRAGTYVMYCRSGNRSALAADLMRDLGFEHVLEIEGGILAWADSGQPLRR